MQQVSRRCNLLAKSGKTVIVIESFKCYTEFVALA